MKTQMITDATGKSARMFAVENAGVIDAMLRATDKATWEAAAEAQNILVRDENDNLVPAPGIDIDAIGAMVVTPGTYGKNGRELTPPVLDNRYHLNMRVSGAVLARRNSGGFAKWKVTALNWTNMGKADMANKAEVGASLFGVCLIDPASVNSPARVWLGD